MADNKKQENDHYFMEQNNAAELARQLRQDRTVTKVMGDLFPVELQDNWHILDLACGPGGWPLDVAHLHHERGISVHGVDIDQKMIDYARSEAEVQELDNLTFDVMDIQPPLNFPDASFDVCNARFLGFFPPEFWPAFVQELYRITKPGGWVRLAETEMGVSNSPGLEQWHEWFFQSLKKANQSFSPNGHRLTITAQLAPLLRHAGFHHVRTQASAIEWGWGSEFYAEMFENVRVSNKLTQQFFLSQKVATQEEMNKNYERTMQEIQKEDFGSVYYMFSAWGQKLHEQKR